MADAINQQIVLKSRPVGEPQESNFTLIETPIPEPREGEVLKGKLFIPILLLFLTHKFYLPM